MHGREHVVVEPALAVRVAVVDVLHVEIRVGVVPEHVVVDGARTRSLIEVDADLDAHLIDGGAVAVDPVVVDARAREVHGSRTVDRAGVEPVMGFCTPEQHAAFLSAVPDFEKMIVNEGIHFFKFWLDIGQAMQLKRFHERVHSPLKKWKFSPMDIAGMQKWEEYGKARDLMLERTHSETAPWTIVEANDKRRSRIAIIRRILLTLPYKERDLANKNLDDDAILELMIEDPRLLRRPIVIAGDKVVIGHNAQQLNDLIAGETGNA